MYSTLSPIKEQVEAQSQISQSEYPGYTDHPMAMYNTYNTPSNSNKIKNAVDPRISYGLSEHEKMMMMKSLHLKSKSAKSSRSNKKSARRYDSHDKTNKNSLNEKSQTHVQNMASRFQPYNDDSPNEEETEDAHFKLPQGSLYSYKVKNNDNRYP